MNGDLIMSEKERKRLVVMEKVKKEGLKLVDAKMLLKLSYPQVKRIWRRFKKEGAKGLLHKNRGKGSNRAYPFRAKVIELYQEKYPDFGPTLASEKMVEIHGYKVDHETLRKWLKLGGIWQPQRKRKAYRKKRNRREHFGEMVQMDGSLHDWFEGRYRKCCAMDMVDDATGETFSQFDNEETTYIAMTSLWKWIQKYGVPLSVYSDRKSVFYTGRESTVDEQLQNKTPLTAFGKSCQKLGIDMIFANSPQAKGRVERKNGVLQDRLIKEMRLAGISDMESANTFLEQKYLKIFNKKFSKPPLKPENYHRPIPVGLDLRDVFCHDEERTVANDWTISYESKCYQILRTHKILPRAKDKVLVRKWLDGTVFILFKNHPLQYQLFDDKPIAVKNKKENTVIKKKYKPSQNHPWKNYSATIISKQKTRISPRGYSTGNSLV